MATLKKEHAESGRAESTKEKPIYTARPQKEPIDFDSLWERIAVRYSKIIAYLAR